MKGSDGCYFHFAVKESLSRSRQLLGHLADSDNHTNTIFLQVSIDGLPLFHSSCKQFWPILGSVCRPVESDPFVTELFCGEKKNWTVLWRKEKLDCFVAKIKIGLFCGEKKNWTVLWRKEI